MIQSSTSSPLGSRPGYPQLGEWLLKSPIMIHLSSSGWMAWRRSVFDGGEYRLYMDRGLPSNINLIPRTSVSSSPDLWRSARYCRGPLLPQPAIAATRYCRGTFPQKKVPDSGFSFFFLGGGGGCFVCFLFLRQSDAIKQQS